MSDPLLSLVVADPGPELMHHSNSVIATAQSFIISVDGYEGAASNLKGAKALVKEIEAKRTEITGPINAGLKKLNALFATISAPAEQAVKVYDAKMLSYRQEQERIAAEAQRKLEAEAAKRREELERQAREAERKAREKADEERRQAEAAAAAGRAEEAAKMRAAAAERERKAAEQAAERREAAAAVVAPTVVVEVPKVAGHSVIETWGFAVVDANLIPREYLMPDEDRIGKVVRALKATTNIPGIKVIRGERQASR